MTSKTRAVERRNPKDWTPEMRKHAMTRLNAKTVCSSISGTAVSC